MELFRLWGSIIIDDKKAIASLKTQEKMSKAVSASYKQFGQDIANVGKVVAVGLATAATAATALVVKFSEVTSEIADNSKKVNMSAKEYQKWTYAAKQSGMEQETLIGLMKKQQTSFSQATNGAKKQAEAYKKLGVDIKNLTSEQGFEAVIKALASMTDETQRNALANDIFGKSYADLMPLLEEGADGIDKLRQRAEELGIVISDEAVAAGDKFGDTMDDLKAIFASIGYQLAQELLPYFQSFSDWVIAHKEDIKKFTTEVITKLGDGLKKVADWVFDITSNKEKMNAFLKDVQNFFGWFTSAAFIAALATHPIITIVGAVASLMAFQGDFANLYNAMTPSNKVLTQLGALALAVGAVLVAATGGTAALPIAIGMAALAGAVGAVVMVANDKTKAAKGDMSSNTDYTNMVSTPWQYGSNQLSPSAYKQNTTVTSQDVVTGVITGLKKVKVVLDDKAVGTFIDDRIITSASVR